MLYAIINDGTDFPRRGSFTVRHAHREGITVIATTDVCSNTPTIFMARTNEEAGDVFSRKTGIEVCLQKYVWRVWGREWLIFTTTSRFSPDDEMYVNIAQVLETEIEDGVND